ncbi:MAG: Two component signal transduction histidine kinase [Acidimicrobiales bacterium]|nr:Two component signal transduction histidine kinase [Acidimicrobiales bacterium]
MKVVQAGESNGRRATQANPRPWWLLHRLTLLVLVLGFAVITSLAVAAWAIHSSNENRLLHQRVSEASLLLTSGLPTIASPMNAAAEVAESTDADPAKLQAFLASSVGSAPGQRFYTLSVWSATKPGRPIVELGPNHLSGADLGSARRFLAASPGTTTLRVQDLLDARRPSLGYAVASARPGHRYVVYARTMLPADRTQRTQSASAFSGLNYVLYFGAKEDPTRILTASAPNLPTHGRRASQVITFVDTRLRLVMYPKGDLGGPLMARLPWLIIIVGVATTLGFGLLAERLIRRRELAQALAAENDQMYQGQRTVAETLQRSLLPDVLPDLPGLEFGARYEPGVEGIEIGGDWYDVVDIDEDRVLLVVGDVSGRGLGAGAVMASLRYAIRAHATQGDGPAEILEKLGTMLNVVRDKHFATVLCIEIDRKAHTLRIADAGHPAGLLLSNGDARFVDVAIGAPIGVATGRPFQETVTTIPPEATLLMFTDGLFERRGEPVDEGMERLRTTSTGIDGTLDELLSAVFDRMTGGVASDDTALLGIRWRS